ncbi:MAG: universal stress protein [Deltaproteobacteria bacterium]|nr:universal stress protein [Deltaproteobacteria bacterium]
MINWKFVKLRTANFSTESHVRDVEAVPKISPVRLYTGKRDGNDNERLYRKMLDRNPQELDRQSPETGTEPQPQPESKPETEVESELKSVPDSYRPPASQLESVGCSSMTSLWDRVKQHKINFEPKKILCVISSASSIKQHVIDCAQQVSKIYQADSDQVLIDGAESFDKEINSKLQADPYDLVVVGRLHQETCGLCLTNDICDYLISHTSWPLLVVHPQSLSFNEAQNILVPFEGTPYCYLALQQALQVTEKNGANLFLFHVDDKDSTDDDQWAQALDSLNWKDVHHNLETGEGEILEQIFLFIKKHGIDLVVLPHHSNSDHTLGLAQLLIEKTNCLIWVVPGLD